MTKFIELPDRDGENHVFNIDTVCYVRPIDNLTRLVVMTIRTLETFDINLPYKEVVKLFRLQGLM